MEPKLWILFGALLCSLINLSSSQDLCGTSPYPDAGTCDREGVTCDDVTKHVMGGIDARRHELPHQVALLWNDGFICGGFLWDSRHVITAQHCTESDPANTFKVIIGEHIRSESDTENPERQIIQVQELIEHEDYDDYWLNDDIAILVLQTDVNITFAKTPICFDQRYGGANTFGRIGTGSGWGSESDNGRPTDQLKYTALDIVDFDDCRNCDGFLDDEVKPGMICAGNCGEDHEHNTCYGDSGGPLFVKGEGEDASLMYAVGITSWGYGCVYPLPGVYTDVAFYEDWINERITSYWKQQSSQM